MFLPFDCPSVNTYMTFLMLRYPHALLIYFYNCHYSFVLIVLFRPCPCHCDNGIVRFLFTDVFDFHILCIRSKYRNTLCFYITLHSGISVYIIVKTHTICQNRKYISYNVLRFMKFEPQFDKYIVLMTKIWSRHAYRIYPQSPTGLYRFKNTALNNHIFPQCLLEEQ